MAGETLTQTQKEELVARVKAGHESKTALGREYGVSPRTVGRIVNELETKGDAASKGRIGRFVEMVKAKFSSGDDTAENATQAPESDDYDDDGVLGGNIDDDSEEGIDSLFDDDDVQDIDPAEVSPAKYIGVVNNGSISITKEQNGEQNSITILKGDVRYDDAFNTILAHRDDLDEAFRLVYDNHESIAKTIENFSHGSLEVDVKREKIYFVYSDTVKIDVEPNIVGRIFEMLDEGDDGQERLLNFADRLMQNPSHRAVKELYSFLDHNDIEITDDGCFVAWKKVRADYTDIHSGTFDNSPGQVLSVPRNMVDEDSNNTCSYGLHVCARHYLGNFGNATNNRVIKVKVDPADVVAVPADYRNAKMRCAGYEVLSDA